MYRSRAFSAWSVGRSPHGERGLKSPCGHEKMSLLLSLPTRGAWIEISLQYLWQRKYKVAPHTGSVD